MAPTLERPDWSRSDRRVDVRQVLTRQVRSAPGREVVLDPIEQVEHVVPVRPEHGGRVLAHGDRLALSDLALHRVGIPHEAVSRRREGLRLGLGAREHVAAVDRGVRLLAQRLLQLRDLGLDRLQRVRVVRAVAGLHHEGAHAAHHVVRVAERRVRLLQPGDAVVDVALELLGVRQLVAQRERPAGPERVVLGPRDLLASGELVLQLGQAVRRPVEVEKRLAGQRLLGDAHHLTIPITVSSI